MKLAPLRNSDRASATAAYEHDDEAAPSPVASASVRGRSSPSSRAIVSRRTTAWTTADRANPRISDQRICQVIDAGHAQRVPDGVKRPHRSASGAGEMVEQLAQAVLESGCGNPSASR